MFLKLNNNFNRCFIGFNGFDVINKISKCDWIFCKKKQSVDMDFFFVVLKGEVKSEVLLGVYLQFLYFF